MKYGKNITIGIMSIIIIILLFYTQILRIEVENIKEGFDDCYKMMNYYADSADVEKRKYEKIIEELQKELKETNKVLRDHIEEK